VRYLLDVNSLIASIWTTHSHHARTDAWLKGKDLATCPLTELGFLRISTHPKALNADMASARSLLADFLEKRAVQWVAADLPALNAHGEKSDAVTDFYLAELAHSKGMKLATLDCGIKHQAIELIR
jgi:predicted nucleic acid-binding protein